MENSQEIESDEKLFAALCYAPFMMLNFLVPLFVLATQHTKKFARFHAVQSLLFSLITMMASFLLFIALAVGLVVFGNVMYANYDSGGAALLSVMLMSLTIVFGFAYLAFFIIFDLAFFIIFAILAFQGRKFKIPLICGFAEKWA